MKKGLLGLACLALLILLPACKNGCGPCQPKPKCEPVCHKVRKPVYAEYEICTSERKIGEVCDETDCRLVCDEEGKTYPITQTKGGKKSRSSRRSNKKMQYEDNMEEVK